jgi:hypothetical protein
MIDALLDLSPDVRYVAVARGGVLASRSRSSLSGASSDESDRYEELLVNPTLLTLLNRRGEIDCGGLSYVLVRYGRFFQFVRVIQGGHVSVALEPNADMRALADRIIATVEEMTP